MARTKAQEKGDFLEKAVELIERFILDDDPNATVTIEPKKIIVVNKVKHEIDIYITIDHGKGYKALFVFECKNWTKKVDKNEIIVFSKKIEVTHAQKGYFIGKSFTEDAKAQAEQDGRVELLFATEELEALPSYILGFHILSNLIKDSNINLFFHQEELPRRLALESFVQYNNEQMLLRTLNERIRQNIVNEFMSHVSPDSIGEGVCSYERTKSLVFQPSELIVEGHECVRLDMKVLWDSRIIYPPIVSKFDIKTRGRVTTYDSGTIPYVGNLQISFVQKE